MINKVTIYFARHANSCSNGIQQYGSFINQWKRLVYKDPPLNNMGVNQTIQLAKEIDFSKGIDIIACSTMLRAQETANYLFPKSKKPIFIFPYIKEQGSTAGNQVSTPTEQKTWLGELSSRFDYRFVVEDSGNFIPRYVEKSSLSEFLKWLGEKLPDLCKLMKIKKKHIKIFIVTHSNFLKRFVSVTHADKPYNTGVTIQEYVYCKGILQSLKFPLVTTFFPRDTHEKSKSEGVVFKGVKPLANEIFFSNNLNARCLWK
jgi:broad specificity phosphatase PhoE